jgi:phytoene desaturase
VPCDALVLTCDLPLAHRLLGGAPRRPVRLRWAPSAVVLHTGGPRRTWPDAAHPPLSFGAAWERTFTEITRAGALMSDPSLLVTTPTLTDPGLAPEGRSLHYVLAPCPNLETGPHDWARLAPRYRDGLLATLHARGFDGLGTAPEVEHLVTPADWAARGHAAGTPFSAAHTFAQTGPFRPRNLPDGWENVVLAGCGTTPGVGVPTTVLSGRLAAARVTGAHRPAARRPYGQTQPRPRPRRAADRWPGRAAEPREGEPV